MIVQDDLILHVLIQNQILEDLRDPQILHGLHGLQDLAKETNALKEVIVRVLTDQDLIDHALTALEAIDRNAMVNLNRAHREVAADHEITQLLSLEMSVLAIAH